MKVVLAIDDSPYSRSMIEKIAKRHWPPDTEFKILTVIEPVAFEEFGKGKWSDVIKEAVDRRKKVITCLCNEMRKMLQDKLPDVRVHFEIREGSPKHHIIDAATEWSADKIVIGAHGKGVCPRFILGSVSRSVASHAPCTVEIVRAHSATTPAHDLVKTASAQT